MSVFVMRGRGSYLPSMGKGRALTGDDDHSKNRGPGAPGRVARGRLWSSECYRNARFAVAFPALNPAAAVVDSRFETFEAPRLMAPITASPTLGSW